MNYSTITNYTDKAYGLKRIEFYNSYRKLDLCFPQHVDESVIQTLISEVQKADPNKTVALMTKRAMGRYLNLPDYAIERMQQMSIGEIYEVAGVRIEKLTEHTSNGQLMRRVAIRVRYFI